MNILGKLIKKFETVAFILGSVAGIYLLVFYPARHFVMWHALPITPEPVEKLISADHAGGIVIKTISNKMLVCNSYHEERCWTEIEHEPILFGDILCFKEDCPDQRTLQMIKATGRLHNFGELSFIYSFRDDGYIYIRHKGLVYLPGYMMGAIIGGICVLIAFIGKHLFYGISKFLHRDSSN